MLLNGNTLSLFNNYLGSRIKYIIHSRQVCQYVSVDFSYLLSVWNNERHVTVSSSILSKQLFQNSIVKSNNFSSEHL